MKQIILLLAMSLMTTQAMAFSRVNNGFGNGMPYLSCQEPISQIGLMSDYKSAQVNWLDADTYNVEVTSNGQQGSHTIYSGAMKLNRDIFSIVPGIFLEDKTNNAEFFTSEINDFISATFILNSTSTNFSRKNQNPLNGDILTHWQIRPSALSANFPSSGQDASHAQPQRNLSITR